MGSDFSDLVALITIVYEHDKFCKISVFLALVYVINNKKK